MTWSRKVARIAARAPPGLISPISGTTLSATRTAWPASAQEGGHLVPGVDVARDDDRAAQRGAGEPSSVVQQHFRVAAVGAADEQDEVGQGPLDGPDLARRRACRTRRGPPSRRRSARRGIPPRRSPAARTPPPRAAARRPRSSRPAVVASSRAPSRSASSRQPSRTSVPRVVRRLRRAANRAVRSEQDRLGVRRADVEAEQVGRRSSRTDRESVCVGRTPRSRRPGPRRRR